MKILILSMSTGNGHNAVAKTLYDYLSHKDINVKSVDVLQSMSCLLKISIEKGYKILSRYFPKLYGRFYCLTEKNSHSKKHVLYNFIDSLPLKKLTGFINEYHPDLIICTHVFASMIIVELKVKAYIKCRTMGILTDFTIHKQWKITDMDVYAVPSFKLKTQMIDLGIKQSKIIVTGIPVDSVFYNMILKSEVRKELGIQNEFTVLIMANGLKSSDCINIIKKLDALKVQIIVLCGKNDSLRNKIDVMSTNSRLYIYNYVNDVSVLMNAADVFIGKPGGITAAECIAQRLPIISVHPIMGQEEKNEEYLSENKLAFNVKCDGDIGSIVDTLRNDTVITNEIMGNMKMCNIGEAVEIIYSCIKKMHNLV